MADVKISALPAATTPLAGTEVLPIVQSSTTKKVAISDVTAGRAVSASSLTLTTPLSVSNGGTGLTSLTAGYIPFGAGTSAFDNSANLVWDNTNKRLNLNISTSTANRSLNIEGAGAAYPSTSNPSFRLSNLASGRFFVFETDSSQNTNLWNGDDGTTGAIRFLSGTGTGTENMRIAYNGAVGIGTSSPTEKLTVSGAAIATSAASSIARDAAIIDFSSNTARFVAGRAGGSYGTWAAYVAGASGVTNRYQIDYDSTFRWYGSDGTTERMRIDSSGNVGIGETSPSTYGKLAVAGPVVVNTTAFKTGTLGATLGYYTSGTYPISYIQMPPSGGFQIWDSTTAAKLVLDTSGNLGIGISSPSTRLHVAGGNIQLDNNQAVQWGGGTNYIYGNNSTNILVFATNNTERARIDSSGNIIYQKLIATGAAAPTIASATTIAPTTPIVFISGTTAIATITAPSPISSGGGQITLIPTGIFTTTIAGNIALASTAVVNKALIMTYDTTTAKWYPSY